MALGSIEALSAHFTKLSSLLAFQRNEPKLPLKREINGKIDGDVKRNRADLGTEDQDDSDEEFHSLESETDEPVIMSTCEDAEPENLPNTCAVQTPTLGLREIFQEKIKQLQGNRKSANERKDRKSKKDKKAANMSDKNSKHRDHARESAKKPTPHESKIKEQQSVGSKSSVTGEIANSNIIECNEKRSKSLKQSHSNPSQALQKLLSEQEKIARLPQEKQDEIKEQKAWEKAELLSQGVRVRDNPALLEKAIKKQQKSKQKRKDKWAERTERVESAKMEKQQKRRDNIQKRKDSKKHKKSK